MSFFISEAYAQAAATPPVGNPADKFTPFLFLGMIVIMYFVMIRPQRKRQKEHTNMVAALAKGDEVVTSSGIMGKVNKVDDDYVVLQVADNVELKFQKVAIHAVLPKGTLKSI